MAADRVHHGHGKWAHAVRMKFRIHTDEATRFAPGAFDQEIGRTVAVKIGGGQVNAVMVAVVVDSYGKFAEMTLEVPDHEISLVRFFP
jgi:hypothetical protein